MQVFVCGAATNNGGGKNSTASKTQGGQRWSAR
jgi:hypothetical protein